MQSGVRAGLINVQDLLEVGLFRRQFEVASARYPGVEERRLLHEAVRRMINFVVVDLIRTTSERLAEAKPKSIDDIRNRARPLVGLSKSVAGEHQELKLFLRDRVYRHYKVLRMTAKARRTLTELFEAFFRDINLMPTEHRDGAARAEKALGATGRARAVADYVAGMTDRYAILEHRRLFDPGSRT